MQYEIRQQDKFKFLEEGSGEPLMLLHGLFGALSNFEKLIEYFRRHNKVVVPMLPLLDMDILHTSVGGLAKFVHKFIEARGYKDVHLLGNSLLGISRLNSRATKGGVTASIFPQTNNGGCLI